MKKPSALFLSSVSSKSGYERMFKIVSLRMRSFITVLIKVRLHISDVSNSSEQRSMDNLTVAFTLI